METDEVIARCRKLIDFEKKNGWDADITNALADVADGEDVRDHRRYTILGLIVAGYIQADGSRIGYGLTAKGDAFVQEYGLREECGLDEAL